MTMFLLFWNDMLVSVVAVAKGYVMWAWAVRGHYSYSETSVIGNIAIMCQPATRQAGRMDEGEWQNLAGQLGVKIAKG
jgi:hypothetical protein